MSDPKTPAYWDPIVDNAMGHGHDWVIRRNVAHAVSMEVEFKVLPAAARSAQIEVLREMAAQLERNATDLNPPREDVAKGIRWAAEDLRDRADDLAELIALEAGAGQAIGRESIGIRCENCQTLDGVKIRQFDGYTPIPLCAECPDPRLEAGAGQTEVKP